MSNALVSEYRAANPHDPRLDKDLTLLFGDSRPDLLETYPDFRQQYNELSISRRERSAGPILSEIPRGIASGFDLATAKLYDTAGQVGQFVGSERLTEFGRTGYERNIRESQENAPTIGRLEEANTPSRLARYVAGVTAQQAPQLGLTLAGAAVGGAVGGVPGAIVGGGIASYTQNQSFSDLVDQGVDPDTAAATGLGVGLASAALETIVPLKIVRKFLPGVTRQVADGYLRRVIRDVPVNALLEGGTEAAQEVAAMAGELYANQDNPRFELSQKEIFSRLLNNGVPGALLGGMTGFVEAIPGRKLVSTPEAENNGNPPTFSTEVARYVEGFTNLPPDQQSELTAMAQRQAQGDLTMEEQGVTQAVLSQFPLGVQNAYRLLVDQFSDEGFTATGFANRKVYDATEGQESESNLLEYPGDAAQLEENREDRAPLLLGQGEVDSGVIPEVRQITPQVAPAPNPIAAVRQAALQAPRKAKAAKMVVPAVKSQPAASVAPAPAPEALIDALDVEGGTTDATGSWWQISPSPENLTKAARSNDPAQNKDKGFSRRAVFAKDNATGQIWLLGSYDNRGLKVVSPEKGHGVAFETFMGPAESPRYTMLASVRFKGATKWMMRPVSEQEFTAIENAAFGSMANQRSTAEAVAAQMARPSGEASGGSVSQEEALQAEARDMIIESLPRDADGQIKRTLTQQEVREGIVWGFEQPGNELARTYLLREALDETKGDPKFQSLDNVGKIGMMLDWLSRRIYERLEKRKELASPGELWQTEKLIQGIFGRDRQADEGTGTAVKFRISQEVAQGFRASEASVRSAFRSALHNIQAAGADVRLFQQRLDGLIDEFFNRPGGAYQDAGRVIALVMKDLTDPSREDFITLLHEALHDLIAQEPNQAAIHRAIDGWAERFTGDPEEAFVEALAQQGVTALESGETAQGLAAALWRKVKEIFQRVAMLIQESIFGQASPGLAESYFANRLQQLVSGDRQRNFIWWLGGPRATPEFKSVHVFRPVDGGWQGGIFNYDTQAMEYGDVVPTGELAHTFNLENAEVKFRKGESLIEETTPAGPGADIAALTDIASYNELADIYSRLYVAWGSAGLNKDGLSLEAFRQQFLEAEDPVSQAANLIAKVVELGYPAPDATARISTLTGLRKPTARKALYALNNVRSRVSERASDAARSVEKLRRQATRLAEQEARLARDYKRADYMAERISLSLRGIIQTFKDNLRSGTEGGYGLGVLAQHISEILAAKGEIRAGGTPVIAGGVSMAQLANYERVINDLASKIDKNPVTFGEMLKAMAKLRVDWKSTPLSAVIDLLKMAAAHDKRLSPLINDTPEARALLAVALSFAKINDGVMAFMELDLARDLKAETAIREMVQTAVHETDLNLPRAKEMVGRVTTQARLAERIYQHYMKVRSDAAGRAAELRETEAFLDFHKIASDRLRREGGRLEEMLEVTKVVEITHGAEIFVAPAPTSSDADVEKSKRTYSLSKNESPTMPSAELRGIVERNLAWLEYPGRQKGEMWATVKAQTDKLKMEIANKAHVAIKKEALTRLFSSIGDRVAKTGAAVGRKLRQRLNTYVTLTGRFHPDNWVRGVEWAMAYGDALKATGIADPERFQSLFYHSALKYFEDRKDLREGPDPQRAALQALHHHFLNQADTKDIVGKAGVWEKLEKFYRASANTSDGINKTRMDMGIPIQDDTLGIFRMQAAGLPLFTMTRKVRKTLLDFYLKTHELSAWQRAIEMSRLSNDAAVAEIEEQYRLDPAAFEAEVAQQYTPDVIDRFVRPMTNRPVRSMFSAPRLASGTVPLASIHSLKTAFRESGGNMVQFARRLYALEGRSAAQTEAQFIAETLNTFNNYYGKIAGNYADVNQADSLGIATIPQQLMHNRESEDYPSEWLEYQTYFPQEVRVLVDQLAMHASFGRGLTAITGEFGLLRKDLTTKASELQVIRDRVAAINPTKTASQIEDLVKKEVVRTLGTNEWVILSNASKHLAEVGNADGEFRAWFQSQSRGQMEVNRALQGIRALTSMVVQGPGTALLNTLQMFDPIVTMGLSRQAIKMVARNWSGFVKEAFGTFAQILGGTVNINADYALRRMELGYYDPDTVTRVKDRMKAIIDSDMSRFAKAAHVVQEATRVGISPVRGINEPASSRLRFASLKPTAPFTQLTQWMRAAMIDGAWRGYEDMVTRAVEYLRENPGAVADPSFEFKPEHLAYQSGALLNDAKGFEYIYEVLLRWGMPLESVARAAFKREVDSGGKDKSLFTAEQYSRLASMVTTELSLDSNIANRAIASFSNPILRMSLPLLSWSVARVDQLRKAFREPNGQASHQAMINGAKVMTAMIPLGLAYAFLLDKYGERVLGKKMNLRSLGTDNTVWQNFLAMFERTARVGTLGIAGDFPNTLLNMGTGGDLRGISIDSRVLFMNSTLGVFRALTALLHQEEGTYATVYRPLLQAMGGSGYLQMAQIMNNALSLNNAESKVTARINVGNYLRAVGREMELDVRVPSGGGLSGSSLPNRVKPWVAQMALSAYSDDMAGFQAAYNRAIEAATESGKPDPAEYVRRSYGASHPLRAAFVTPPSVAEYAQIISNLNPHGQQAVQEAVDNYNRFGERVGLKPYLGREKEQPKQTQSNPFTMPASIRMRGLAPAGQSYLFTR